MDEFRLLEGDRAPEFSLQNQEGKSVSLSDFAGRGLIVFFFPAASSPGCTKEASDFNDNIADLRAAGYELVGISPDPVDKLKRFWLNQELDYTLLSDTDLAAHKAFGSYGEKNLYGRIYRGVMRSTIVIGANGQVELALYNVKATGHVQMLRRKLSI
ncbi:MAG: peroxiredoxin [Micrococcales bacterium]